MIVSGLPGRAHGLDQGTSGDLGGRLAASGLDGIRAEVVLGQCIRIATPAEAKVAVLRP